MRKIIGGIMALAVTAFVGWMFYLCLWVMLVGGIVGIIDQVKAPVTDSTEVAISIVMIVLCELPLIPAAIACVLGYPAAVYVFCSKPPKNVQKIHPSF